MTDRPADPPPAAAPEPQPVELIFRSTRLIRSVVAVSVAVELLLVIFDYHVNYGGLTRLGALRRLANITREDSLASWVGTTQTSLVALTVWWIWLVVCRTAAARWRRIGWLVVAAFFTLMAVDDGAMLHERAGTVFSELNSSDSAAGPATGLVGSSEAFPSYAWQLVALPLFVALGAFILVFLWRALPSSSLRWLVLVALTCFAVAVALDFVEGLDDDHPWNLHAHLTAAVDFGDYTEYRFGHDAFDTVVHFSKSLEEFLEMLGNTLLWYVFLRTLVGLAADVRVRFV